MSRTAPSPLGPLVRIRTGKLDANANNPSGQYPFFTCSKTPLRISSYSFDCECVLVAGNGDLNVKYYEGKFDAYQRTYIIESLDSGVLSPKYLFRFLSEYVDELRRGSVGGVIKFIKLGHLTKALIPVPPLAEQERIVKLLDEADELRKLRAQADRRTAALIPALFHEMFGDAELHCSSVTIEKAVEQFIDYRGKTPEKSLSGVPLVTAKIVKGGRILPPTEYIPEVNYDSWMRRGLPRMGDVLFTMEAPLGEVAMVKDTHIALAQRILLMRPRADILDSCYFMTALKMPCVWKQIEERATGSTVRGIRQAELRKITMPIPPLPLQKKFAQRVSEIRELETAQAASRQRVEHLFQSMLHRAFNQEL